MKYITIILFIVFAFGCSKQDKTSNQNADSVKNSGSASGDFKQTSQTVKDTNGKLNDEEIIYEATEGAFKSKSGHFLDIDCNETVEYYFELIDLNDDAVPEVFQTISGSQMCYGKYGCETNTYFKNENGKWATNTSWLGCFELTKLPTMNKGYHDIKLSSVWPDNKPVWRWNGNEYELFKKN